MHARSTTVYAHLESIDTGIRHVRDEVMPMLRDMDGAMGLSMLVERESGRCIITSSWQSRDAMHASEPRLRPVRDHLAEVLGGRAQVDEWEIAVLHRDHAAREGACVRATWMRLDGEQFDRGIDVYKMASMPALEELSGFCSASLLVDRPAALAVSSVTYDSVDAMERTRDEAGAVREAGTHEVGAAVLDVCEFELALAHLHVPEMA